MRIIVTPIIIHQTYFAIPHLTTPLDGLGDGVGGGHGAEGSVSVRGRNIACGAVELTDVLGEIPTVGIPSAADLDSQRTSGGRLGGIPGDEPKSRVVAAGEVDAGDL